MPATKSEQMATMRYMRKTYDRLEIIAHKGKKDSYKAHATAMGESLNAFVNRAITETIARDTQPTPQPNEQRATPPTILEKENPNITQWRKFFNSVNASDEKTPETFERLTLAERFDR